MAQQKPGPENSDSQSSQLLENDHPQALNSEMAKAFQELAKGESTASALEAKLDGIEDRIDQLLASMEGDLKQNTMSSGGSQST
ncbi:uncharacterized protein A1O9_00743 [Exophiala aquamarina CBS 119918]|uniref:Heat shock factor binding protein 1 n=1 Tax=Exophiala aquamarina CBS 119918 TaxID=1182545 RepID=A0A072Q4G1_9EURO|nr:uncharacterized protein A1O9_00743 [Exophiala aquamarina CBS 119918]KEF62770.1 hypothetical protein A1O9_00743 [Exophiala aquamarina CBS 119918]